MSDLPDVDLVFVSGVLSPDIWKHQKKYFSRCTNVELVGGKEYGDLYTEIQGLIEENDNVILVGAEMGNYLIQEFEGHDNVVSTVLTGPFDSFSLKDEWMFKAGKKFLSHPKLAKKLLFSAKTDYSVVKEFIRSSGIVDYECYRSYRNLSLRMPVKNSLIIYNQDCRFSTMNTVEDFRPNSEIAILDAGSFSFFEKPQEYNKALHDYLVGRKDLLERRELVRSASRNRSLKDFEEKIQLEP
jgi:hypothetical protein